MNTKRTFFIGNKWSHKKFVSYRDMLSRIHRVFPDFYKISDKANDTSKVSTKLSFSIHKHVDHFLRRLFFGGGKN